MARKKEENEFEMKSEHGWYSYSFFILIILRVVKEMEEVQIVEHILNPATKCQITYELITHFVFCVYT